MVLKSERMTDPRGSARLILSGAIDDTAQLDGLFDDLPESFTLDLSGIERINSIGIKHWISSFAAITTMHRISIEGISYPMVIQANCLRNLFGNAEVVSCMAPYYCSECNASRNVLVTRAEAVEQIPTKTCPDCSTELVFDELDGYFGFFERDDRAPSP